MELWIFGAGGHAKIVADTALKLERYEKIIFHGNGESKIIESISDKFFLQYNEPISQPNNKIESFIGIGEGVTRKKIYSKFKDHSFCNIISKESTLSNRYNFEEGIFVGPGAVINIDAHISKHVIVNTNSIIEHDCFIGDFSQIAPGAVICGGVSLGSNVFVGANSCINPGVSVCDDVIIGSGSVVINDISKPGSYVGIPAKRL